MEVYEQEVEETNVSQHSLWKQMCDFCLMFYVL